MLYMNHRIFSEFWPYQNCRRFQTTQNTIAYVLFERYYGHGNNPFTVNENSSQSQRENIFETLIFPIHWAHFFDILSIWFWAFCLFSSQLLLNCIHLRSNFSHFTKISFICCCCWVSCSCCWLFNSFCSSSCFCSLLTSSSKSFVVFES